MKLLLIWLLAVPALVAAMVVARAMSPQGMRTPARNATVELRAAEIMPRAVRSAPVVLAAVADDGHRIACHRFTVQ